MIRKIAKHTKTNLSKLFLSFLFYKVENYENIVPMYYICYIYYSKHLMSFTKSVAEDVTLYNLIPT